LGRFCGNICFEGYLARWYFFISWYMSSFLERMMFARINGSRDNVIWPFILFIPDHSASTVFMF
jgi:hypothetical protein